MIEANSSALEITGITASNFEGINLFNNPYITIRKEKLVKGGLIKFQAPISFDDINTNNKDNGFYNPTKKGTSYLDWIISVIDSGFLVQVQDVTDRKIAEDSLRESEEKYHRLFDDDLTGDFIASCDSVILECNPAFAEIYGFTNREKAVGHYFSHFNPEDWKKLVARLKSQPKIMGYQTWHKRRDNQDIHVIANVVGIFDDFGELVQVKGYVFDDTDRKIAEDSLRESEEKYHRLFDDDLTGDFIASCDGTILECNPAFAEIYGFNNCQMASQCNISQFNSFDWPYLITRLKRESKIKGYQSWQRRSDGMRIHVIANVVGIFDDFGELVQVKGYVFDDTDRKIAEEELINSKSQMKEILDSIQDCFVAIGPYWNFTYVNNHAAEYFGVDADDVMGQNIWELFPELKSTLFEKTTRKALKNKEIQHFEYSGIHNTNKLYDFSIYPSSEGLSIYWKDVTKRKLETNG